MNLISAALRAPLSPPRPRQPPPPHPPCLSPTGPAAPHGAPDAAPPPQAAPQAPTQPRGAGGGGGGGSPGSPRPQPQPPGSERAGAPAEPLSSDGEGARSGRAASVRGHPSGSSETTSPSSDPGIEADLRSRTAKPFLPGGRRGDELSSPGSDSDVDGELEAAFAGGRLVSNMISSISETELDLSSDSSSGRSSHLTNSIEEASSPGSEGELEAELDAPGLLGIKDSLLLDKGKEEEEEEREEAAERELRRESLAELKADAYYDSLEPADGPAAPPGRTDVSSAGPLDLKIDPDHSLESIRRSFYLPVGPKLMPEADEEEEEDNSEYDSDSESEPDLSEDSDSPWLLSNLVNKMISEGSYPIKCPDECFQNTHSLCDTISPASDLEPEILGEALDEEPPPRDSPVPAAVRGDAAVTTAGTRFQRGSIELVDMETLRSSLAQAEQAAQAEPPPEPPAEEPGPFLFLSNPTNDTIAPVCPGRPVALDRLDASEVLATLGCRPAPPPPPPRVSPGPEDGDRWALDSGVLEADSMIDDVRLAPGHADLDATATPDASTAKTNLGFALEEDEAQPPSVASRRASPAGDVTPAPPERLDESLAYDSVKYTLVVDEHTQLELVSLRRCTSVLSDDSDVLRAGDDEVAFGDGLVAFGDGLVAPDARSSSEDSSPEADLQFSKKFLNVFVNSTSRSSSKWRGAAS
uniref:Uncharacterized protein n=1 Tax=Cyanoderma ruficeps TaxID=181631 RepID=A0A8C3X7U1_9PASS